MSNSRAESFSPVFYKHIDAPLMLLFFDVDDLAIGIAVLQVQLIGSLILGLKAGGNIYIAIVLAVIAGISYNKFKQNKPKGYIFQSLYRKGFYHPLSRIGGSVGIGKYIKNTKEFKVAPKYYTTVMKGQ